MLICSLPCAWSCSVDYWPRLASIRHDLGIAASPLVRDTVKVGRSESLLPTSFACFGRAVIRRALVPCQFESPAHRQVFVMERDGCYEHEGEGAMSTRITRWGTITAVIALGLTLFAGCTPPWTPPPPPTPYFSATDISLDSPTDGWAVGAWIVRRNPPPGATPGTSLTAPQFASFAPAMAHLQHGQWRLAPASQTGVLDAYQSYNHVRLLSPSDGWATTRSQIYHYTGVRWSLVFPPKDIFSRSIVIQDVQVLPSGVGWAVGPDGILRYAHGAWVNITASLPPRPADWELTWPYPGLRSVAVISASDAWATGDGGAIWRYDGAVWRIVASPYFPNRFYTSPSVNGYTASPATLAHIVLQAHASEALLATQLLSPTQGWSVGGGAPESRPNAWGPAVVEQYQAGVWQVTHVISGNIYQARGQPELLCVAMTSAEDGWVGGASYYWGKDYTPLLVHYHARQWTFTPAPAVGAIHRIEMLSPDEGWAAADGGLLQYTGGQWRLVTVSPSA
jgi:hypothetical protein